MKLSSRVLRIAGPTLLNDLDVFVYYFVICVPKYIHGNFNPFCRFCVAHFAKSRTPECKMAAYSFLFSCSPTSYTEKVFDFHNNGLLEHVQ